MRSAEMEVTPCTLDRVPHLAVLDVIHHALHVAIWALAAEFPVLMGEPHPWLPDPPDLHAARRLHRKLYLLIDDLARYRRALAALHGTPAPPRDDDLDF